MRTVFWSLVFLGLILVADADAQRGGRGGRGMRGGGRGMGQDSGGLQVVEISPGFVLKSLDGESETDLHAIRTEKPVVLYFGSYT